MDISSQNNLINRQLSFHDVLKDELESFIRSNQNTHPQADLLTLDLHCHDHNSDVPDELLGRILNLPETWLPTENLLRTLKKHGCDTFTVTNHNNARSCFELLDKGEDILVGAEFSCMVPEFETGIHVLTYGFTPHQEERLKKLRKNIYAFQEYAIEHNIPTIWAHPLYHYKSNGTPPLEFFDKMALIFERFEVLNGQRDAWQNLLVKRWVDTLTEEKIYEISKQTNINPAQYCRTPYKKFLSGGSDSHMGIFSGLTGTKLYVPDLATKRLTYSTADLALDAIWEGRMSPYGAYHNSEKMSVTLLDYACQIALYGKDPGLMRILLHKGEVNDKIIALGVANGFTELRRHKVTMNFIKLFHDCFTGVTPHFTKRWFIPRVYKPVFDKALAMSESNKGNPDQLVAAYKDSIYSIYGMMGDILAKRLGKKLEKLGSDKKISNLTFNDIVKQIEIPASIRSIINEQQEKSEEKKKKKKDQPTFIEFMDGLSFPFLASTVILSSCFASAKALYNARPLLNDFAKKLGYLEHPQRMLWLTDTFEETNGVSTVLRSWLKQIQLRNLPIDILICSDNIVSEDHLIVIKPQMDFAIPFYNQQRIRIPNILEVFELFNKGAYDRIICSTEGPMGMISLFLKHAYTIPAYFYVHTDWMMFVKKVLNFDNSSLNQFRRLLRLFYSGFDKLYVLNSSHQKWFSGNKMAFQSSSVMLTAHWVEDNFNKRKSDKYNLFGLSEDTPVVLFSGRVSYEKGVLELPYIMHIIKLSIPNVRIVIAGSGPAEQELREALPEAIFLGWLAHEQLPAIYSSADLLLLPSRFDTFGCVVLEAMRCALPVIAYNTKGPKDLIIDGENGYLVVNSGEMAAVAVKYLSNPVDNDKIKDAALMQSNRYNANVIIDELLQNAGFEIRKGVFRNENS